MLSGGQGRKAALYVSLSGEECFFIDEGSEVSDNSLDISDYLGHFILVL